MPPKPAQEYVVTVAPQMMKMKLGPDNQVASLLQRFIKLVYNVDRIDDLFGVGHNIHVPRNSKVELRISESAWESAKRTVVTTHGYMERHKKVRTYQTIIQEISQHCLEARNVTVRVVFV